MKVEKESDFDSDWILPSCIATDEETQKYRPKLIREYEENGIMIKVYEARYV